MEEESTTFECFPAKTGVPFPQIPVIISNICSILSRSRKDWEKPEYRGVFSTFVKY
jgi:hypothetical protein